MKNKIMISITIIAAAIVLFSLAFSGTSARDLTEQEKYALAVKRYDAGEYKLALNILENIQGFSTSQSYYDECIRLLEEYEIPSDELHYAIYNTLFENKIVPTKPYPIFDQDSYERWPVYKMYTEQLKTLDISGYNIDDISFLAGFTNLEELILDDNNITDLSPITDLYKLRKLSLKNNKVEDITPLYKLTNLTYLDLSHNHIVDTTPLYNMAHIEKLDISNNQIKDIDSLSVMQGLTELNISNNEIEGIWVVMEMTSLSVLNASHNKIKNMRSLSDNKSLKELYLMDNDFESVAALSHIESLEVLEIGAYWASYEDDTADIEEEMTSLGIQPDYQFQDKEIFIDGAFDHLPNLRKLKMVNVGIASFEFLQGCPNMQELSLVDSVVYAQDDTLENVTYLKNLTYLELNNIRTQAWPGNVTTGVPMCSNELVAKIGEVVSLTHLDIGVNCFSDLSPLGNLTNLTYLDISNTHSDIKDISFLSRLQNLTHLAIGNTPSVIDYSPLKDLNNLEYLDLFLANLKYFEYISHMDKLKYLNLQSAIYNSINGIENMNDLEYLNLDTWYNNVDEKIAEMRFSPFESNEEREEYEANYRIIYGLIRDLRNIKEYYGNPVEGFHWGDEFSDDKTVANINIYSVLKPEHIEYINSFKNLEKLYIYIHVEEDREIVIPYIENLWYLNIDLDFEYMNNPNVDYKPTVTIDLSAFEGHTNLQYLSIWHRGSVLDYRDKQLNIPSLNALESCVNLRAILINDANLSDISALANCDKLEIVDFCNCSIEDISALENKYYLKDLTLMNNNIRDISPLENCYRLKRIRMWDNPVSNRTIKDEWPCIEDWWFN